MARKVRITADELYRRYKRDYNLQERRMRRRGEAMDSDRLSKDDFFAVYESVKNDLEDYSRNMGARKPSPQKVIDEIVSDQQYEISKRQARAYQTALENTVDDWESDFAPGERPALTPLNIRRGKFDKPLENTFEQVRAFRERMIKEGIMKGKELAEEVSSRFFGSK